MPTLKNFVAVDWRAGQDRFYFFFKDSNTYSLFHIGDHATPDEYPTAVNYDNWHDFHKHVKHLRFGFTTRHLEPEKTDNMDQDELWLFYDDGDTPMVCKYDQDEDKVRYHRTVRGSKWHDILPYFKNIIAGTWWENPVFGFNTYRFLMDNGQSLSVNFAARQSLDYRVKVEPINDRTWPGLAPYKHRIITAAQNDRTLSDSHFYIFLTDNEYITYNIPKNEIVSGPSTIDESSWPGLLRD